MNFLRKVKRQAIMEWSKLLQYRADIMLWMITDAATPLISLAVWYTIAQHASSGPSPKETFTYYILVMLTVSITNAWGGFFLAMEILNGDVVKDLMKPFPLFWNYILNNITEKVIKLLIPLPLFLIAITLFQSAFTESIYDIRLWLICLVSLFLAVSLGFTLDILFGILAFWLEDAQQLRNFKDTLGAITSGILIPIAVMPEKVQTVINVLPFRSIITTPIEIILGNLTTLGIIQGISIQIAWLLATTIVVYVLWKKGLKRYAPPGQ